MYKNIFHDLLIKYRNDFTVSAIPKILDCEADSIIKVSYVIYREQNDQQSAEWSQMKVELSSPLTMSVLTMGSRVFMQQHNSCTYSCFLTIFDKYLCTISRECRCTKQHLFL